MDIERKRAAGFQPFAATSTTTGNEPLTVDLVFPQDPKQHWIVHVAAFRANLTAKQPNTAPGFPPLTGLFLVPVGTAPEPIVTTWMNDQTRYLLLPMGPPGASVATIVAGPPFAFAMTLANGQDLVVPYGFMLRAIVVCDAGNAAPGPGAGSIGTLTALAYRERDEDVQVCL